MRDPRGRPPEQAAAAFSGHRGSALAVWVVMALGLLGCTREPRTPSRAQDVQGTALPDSTPPGPRQSEPKTAQPTPEHAGEATPAIVHSDKASSDTATTRSRARFRAATSQSHSVVRVIDGDTIQVDVEGTLERVRYIGIDTPETVHPRKGVECFGKEASARNRALVEGRKVRLERDVSDRDRYGRLLRYVYVGDVFVNLELVREGYAEVSTYPPDVEHTDAFLDAQREAREANRGLWGACDETTPVAKASSSAPQQESARDPACTIKGNINARGDKIYHLPGCRSYAATVIEEAAGERWFCSSAEAEAAGWRRAGNCPP